MLSPEQVRKIILDNLQCEPVEVAGDGHHFGAVIVSEAFAGKNRVQQHQVVYRALGERMREQIHALSMKTLTPQEWASR